MARASAAKQPLSLVVRIDIAVIAGCNFVALAAQR